MLRFLAIVTIVAVVSADSSEEIGTKKKWHHGGYKPYYGGYNGYKPYYGGYNGYNSYQYPSAYYGGNNQQPLLNLLGPLLAGGLGGLAGNAIAGAGQQAAVPQTGITTGVIGPNGQIIPSTGTTGTTGTTGSLPIRQE